MPLRNHKLFVLWGPSSIGPNFIQIVQLLHSIALPSLDPDLFKKSGHFYCLLSPLLNAIESACSNIYDIFLLLR